MENKSLFLTFLFTWVVFLLITHIWSHRKGLPLAVATLSHIISSIVAIVMTYVFLIAGGATVAQFVSGSDSGMELWRLWFHLWPILLFSAAASAIIGLIWTIIACIKKTQRRFVPTAIGTTAMSTFAFFTVALNFPDA